MNTVSIDTDDSIMCSATRIILQENSRNGNIWIAGAMFVGCAIMAILCIALVISCATTLAFAANKLPYEVNASATSEFSINVPTNPNKYVGVSTSKWVHGYLANSVSNKLSDHTTQKIIP